MGFELTKKWKPKISQSHLLQLLCGHSLVGVAGCSAGRRPPGRVRGQVGLKPVRARVVRVQHGHQIPDVGRGQPERFDLGQLGVGRHVRYAVPEVGKRVVDALRPPPFLFVGRTALDNPHNRLAVLRRSVLLLLLLLSPPLAGAAVVCAQTTVVLDVIVALILRVTH